MKCNLLVNNIKLAFLIFSMLLLFHMNTTHAACHVSNTQNIKFPLPDIVLSSATQPGYILAQKTIEVSEDDYQNQFICTGDGRILALPQFTDNYGHGVYSTNVKGIGYRLFIGDNPFPWQVMLHCPQKKCHLPWPSTPRITFQLVQTLPDIEPGGILHPGVYGIIRTDDGIPAINITLAHAIHLHQESCTIRSKTVDFGYIHIERSSRPGTILATKPFTLFYQCPYQGTIITRWEGLTTDKAGYLSPPQLREKGVMIGIMNMEGSRIQFNKSFKITPMAGELKFVAQLISMGAVSAGNFNASATLHILYP